VETAAPQAEVVVVECDSPKAPVRTAVIGDARTTLGDDAITLDAAAFDDLPGWSSDRHADALPAFVASCEALDALPDDAPVGAAPYAGTAADWRAVCAAARAVPDGDHAAARRLFETRFRAYATSGGDGDVGRVTGYYVAPLRASRTRRAPYVFPLYGRPADLVSIQLDELIPDGRSRRVWGRLDPDTGKVVRYGDRKQIREQLTGDDVLLWVDDPVDAIHVEIEGSGRARLDDGGEVWVGFAGKNGLRSGRNGAVMRAMKKLREAKNGAPWSERDLPAFYEIADAKLSIVFFELQQRGGAIGTQDVVLTPGRSVAVDRAVIPLSAPLWLDTTAPPAPGERHAPWQRLVVAQDTGGAILGSVRVDVYFGDDADAGKIASRVNGPGRVWMLLPRELAAAAATAKHD
jgi:membrane-bound lytic murein transglycosylase A